MEINLGTTAIASGLIAVALICVQCWDLYLNVYPDVRLLLFGGPSSTKKHNRIQTSQNKLLEIIQDFSASRFYIPWNKPNPIIISARDHIRELSDAPQLSQRAVYADLFGLQQSLSYEATLFSEHEQAPHRYKLFSIAIKQIGVSNLPVLQQFLQERLETGFEEFGLQSDGWQAVKMAPFIRNLVIGMFGTCIFGDELYNKPDFRKALFEIYHGIINYQAALKVVPSSPMFKIPVHKAITRNGRALKILYSYLREAIDRPDHERKAQSLPDITLFQVMKDIARHTDSDYWKPDVLIQALTGIWFAAAHQPWINVHFILLELATRTQFADRLRDEVSGIDITDYSSLTNLPLLDSFMKECVRLNPLDKMAIRRKALAPYTFSNGGPSLEPGQIACVSAYNIMHNPERYPDPDTFIGDRFIRDSSSLEQSKDLRGTKFTDASKDFPVWGFGAKVCPGRWHAVLVIKMVLSHLLSKYDFELETPNAQHKWWWETFQLPYESTVLRLRKRTGETVV